MFMGLYFKSLVKCDRALFFWVKIYTFAPLISHIYQTMKKLVSLFLGMLFTVSGAWAQTAATPDTTIYDAPELLPYPLMKSCALELHPGWTQDSARACGEYNLMRMMSQNVVYPMAAREQNIQGTVVMQMTIEPTGRMSSIKIMKDIGGGCGKEALRILQVLDTLGLRWQPGLIGGKPVRARKALPFRFKLTEALPYTFTDGGDTVYTNIDTPIAFKKGDDALFAYILEQLDYPASYKDSCKTGVIEYSLLVRPNGTVNVENQLDFNNLGSDFQFNGIMLANGTANMWTPATYQGRPVPATIPFRAVFKSEAPGCKAKNETFDKAMLLADEGVVLSENQKNTEAIQKFTEALALSPDNTEFLYYRGTMLLNEGKSEEACADYGRIRAILGYTWFEQIRKLVCGW